jgi:hypothetical protein
MLYLRERHGGRQEALCCVAASLWAEVDILIKEVRFTKAKAKDIQTHALNFGGEHQICLRLHLIRNYLVVNISALRIADCSGCMVWPLLMLSCLWCGGLKP